MNSLEDFRDFHGRILRWYDEKLKTRDAGARAVTAISPAPE